MTLKRAKNPSARAEIGALKFCGEVKFGGAKKRNRHLSTFACFSPKKGLAKGKNLWHYLILVSK